MGTCACDPSHRSRITSEMEIRESDVAFLEERLESFSPPETVIPLSESSEKGPVGRVCRTNGLTCSVRFLGGYRGIPQVPMYSRNSYGSRFSEGRLEKRTLTSIDFRPDPILQSDLTRLSRIVLDLGCSAFNLGNLPLSLRVADDVALGQSRYELQSVRCHLRKVQAIEQT